MSHSVLFNSPDLLYYLYRLCWFDTPQFAYINRTTLFTLTQTRQYRLAKYLSSCKNITDALTKSAGQGNLEMLKDLTQFCGPFTRWDYSVALFFSAGSGFINTASYLLLKGADINYDFAFPGVLREAARNDQVQMVAFLLNHGSQEIHQVQKNNALIKSCETGNLDIVKLLLSNGADPNFMCSRCLSAAAHGGHDEIIAYLLSSGANVNLNNRQAMYEASRTGNIKIIRQLLDETNRQSDRNAVLGWSVSHGHAHVVRELISEGADVQFINEHGIYGAAVSGHAEILGLLLEQGISVENQGPRSLLAAASRGYTDIVSILLDYGVDIHLQDDEALFLAASKGHYDLTVTLLRRGASVERGGNRALPYAAANQSFDILKSLFDAGARILQTYDKPLLDVNYLYRYDVMTTLQRAYDEWKNSMVLSPITPVSPILI